jgi:hypothetical protein
MASSNAASMSKIQQYSQRRFGESNPKTLVTIHKADIQLKKMITSLEHEESTAVNNIANHQQAMKMSWRRLEEKRSSSPDISRPEKTKAKWSKRGMMLQSNTKLSVDSTPEIYGERPATVDDNMVGRSSTERMQGANLENDICGFSKHGYSRSVN